MSEYFSLEPLQTIDSYHVICKDWNNSLFVTPYSIDFETICGPIYRLWCRGLIRNLPDYDFEIISRIPDQIQSISSIVIEKIRACHQLQEVYIDFQDTNHISKTLETIWEVPVQKLRVEITDASVLSTLLKARFLKHLRVLSIKYAVPPTSFHWLKEIPLTHLYIEAVELQNKEFLELCEIITDNATLKSLRLEFRKGDNLCIATLLRAVSQSKIISLDLGQMKNTTCEGLPVLKLRHLSIVINGAHIGTYLIHLIKNGCLRYLKIKLAAILELKLKNICWTLSKNSTIQHLTISALVFCNPKLCKFTAKILMYNHTLLRLDFEPERNPNEIDHIINALRYNHTLQYLSVPHFNKISIDNAFCHNQSLKWLHITKQYGVDVSEALNNNTTLRYLNIKPVFNMARKLESTNLVSNESLHVDLSHSTITRFVTIDTMRIPDMISDLMYTSSVIDLTINFKFVSDSIIEAWCEAIAHNQSILIVSIICCESNDDYYNFDQPSISNWTFRAFKRNSSVQHLRVQNNGADLNVTEAFVDLIMHNASIITLWTNYYIEPKKLLTALEYNSSLRELTAWISIHRQPAYKKCHCMNEQCRHCFPKRVALINQNIIINLLHNPYLHESIEKNGLIEEYHRNIAFLMTDLKLVSIAARVFAKTHQLSNALRELLPEEVQRRIDDIQYGLDVLVLT